MKRENYNNDGIIREYGNGNITIKYFPDGIQTSKKDSVLTLSSLLDMIDCYFIGETYNLSNWACGHTIYNAYSDLVYIFNWDDISELENGKTVRLYARKPDETDKEILEKEGF